MQSRRVWLPEVVGPVPAAEVLPSAVAAEPDGRPLAAGDRASRSVRRAGGRRPSSRWRATGCRSATPCCASRPRRSSRPRCSSPGAGRERRRSACTSTCRSAPTRCDYCAFATWTDRPHLDRRLPRRGAHRDRPGGRRRHAGGDERVRRWRHADARARRGPGGGARGRSRSPQAPRSPSSATPTTSPRRCSRRIVAAGVNRVSIGVQSMVPHVLAALGRTHDPANVETRRRRRPRRRAADVQPRHHLRRGGGAARRLADDARARARPRTAARLGLRPDRRGRHAARRRPGPPSRRRRAGRRVRARRRAADGRRAGQLRGVELGPPGPRVPAQPPLLAPARLPRLRVRRPLAPRRSALVEPAHAGALHRRRRPAAARRRPPARRSTPRPAASRGCSCRCARPPACPSTPSTATSSPASSSATSDRWVLTRRGRLMANEVAVRLR